MNYWKHSLMSKKKFGGSPDDYVDIHKFLDSSKLFYFHLKHRLLLHNTFGIELCIEKFGDFLRNADGQVILVRDIAAEHCKEDLYGKVPTLNDWFLNYDETILENKIFIPEVFNNKKLEAFVMKPYLHSGIKASLIITKSNFGVYLAEQFLGMECALELVQYLNPATDIKHLLSFVKFTEKWQYTNDPEQIELLKTIPQ